MSRLTRAATAAALGTAAALTFAAGAHAAPIQLPQVNDDPANSILPNQPAGVSDVAGGSLAAGGVNVPWATFEQKVPNAGQQIFVRAFKNGAWTTQGFPASLNIDPNAEAEAPAIDFAGGGRTVPWVTWYEPSHALGDVKNIFASRFDKTHNVWIPDGQDRSRGGRAPSLNIHTDREAEDPAIAGGAAVAGADPVPWVAWQEIDGAAGTDQIFVSRAAKDADVRCGSLGVFCWVPTGVARLDSGQGSTDPSLNIDPKRDGIEPDIAFTGPNDTVPWAVWYEKGAGTPGRATNEQVFAAKAIKDTDPVTSAQDGGFKWVAVGNAGSAPLDTTAGCLASLAAENACSLNAAPGRDAQDPRVAAGSLAPGAPTSPWVVWSEDTGSGRHAIFVSRLVGGTFQLFNQGQPVSNTVNDATNPDITFVGHEPTISWQEDLNGTTRTFVGHFEGGAGAPVFKLDTPVGLPTAAQPGLRAPVSSDCTANPFTTDGTACPGGVTGTAVALQTAADGRLLGDLFPAPAPAPAPQPAPTPAPTPGGGTPGPIHGASHLSIGGGTLKLSHGRVKVKLSCPSGAACTGTVKLLAGQSRLGSGHFRVRGGHSQAVSVRLTHRAIARVHRAHRLAVRITAGGQTRTATVRG
jgi:hypothetical protein